MPVTIHIWDEVIPGMRSPAKVVTVEQALTTARELIRSRVREEVERHNESLTEVFCGHRDATGFLHRGRVGG
jgi:hypothetical protein